MVAAKYVEATLGAAASTTEGIEFRGRVNVLLDETDPPWSGAVNLERRYVLPAGGNSDWMAVAIVYQAGVYTFVEHEASVAYRLRTVEGLSGGTPLGRLSQ